MPRRPSQLLTTVLVSLSANLTLLVATIVCGGCAMFLGWLPPRGNWTYRFARLWSRWMMLGAWSKVTSEFEQPLDPRQGYVFLANHQSLYDIPAVIMGIPGQARFLAKKSLFRIPFFGWALAVGGFVPVDRSDRKASQETFRVAVDRLEAGHSIILFPEETRSRDGELLPLKRGGVLMALKTGFPIVPVGIDGTRDIRHRDSLLVVRPGRVRVRYGRPINVSEMDVGQSRELQERVRSEIERLKG